MLLYTRLAHLAIADMTRTVPALAHIDPARLLVVAANRMSRSMYGNLAQCIGLGLDEYCDIDYWYQPRTRVVVKASPWFRIENTRVTINERPMRYIIRLQSPRLLRHRPVTTIVHELVHISPDFDGRLNEQRHGRTFDSWVDRCVAEWRERGDPQLVRALSMGGTRLEKEWGSLVGLTFSRRFLTPRKVLMEEQPPLESHPDFARKHLKFPLRGVRKVETLISPLDATSEFSEDDLVYRVFSSASSQRIATAALRSSRSLYPQLGANGTTIPDW